MAIISSLFVKLGADSAHLTKEFEKAKRSARSWSSTTARATKVGAGAFVALASAAAIAGKAIYDSQAPIIDRMGKVSDSVDISVSRLQSYRYAAGLAGVSTQQLDSSVLRFNRQLGKAAEAGGAAAKAYKQLNIDAKDLAELGTDDAFTIVLDQLQSMEDRAVANSIAFDIFGDSATEIMRISSKAINEANIEMDSFGGLIDRVDVAKVEAANAAMFRVDAATEAVSRRLAVDMAPLLQSVAELFFENVQQTQTFKNLGVKAMDAVALSVGWLGNRLQDLKTAFFALGAAGTSVGLGMVKLLNLARIASKEAVSKWQGYLDLAVSNLVKQWNKENFSDALSRRLAKNNEEAKKLAASLKKVGKGAALALSGGKKGEDSDSDGTPKSKESSFFDSQVIALNEYKQSLRVGFAEIEESFSVHYDNRYQLLSEALDREVITQSQYDAQFQNVRLENERKSAAAIQTVRASLTSNLIRLLNNLGERQKIFAKLAVALEARRALAENWQKTAVAAMQAYSSQLIPSYPPSQASAIQAYKKTWTLGKLNAAVITANAVLEASGSGVSASGSGSSSSSSINSGSADAGAQTQTAAQSSAVPDQSAETKIYVLMTGSTDLGQDGEDYVRERLRDLTETGAVSISGNDIDDMKIQVI